jgi:hypothetical protein
MSDCICTRFSDTGGYRIADLACPVHGVESGHPNPDGKWEDDDALVDAAVERMRLDRTAVSGAPSGPRVVKCPHCGTDRWYGDGPCGTCRKPIQLDGRAVSGPLTSPLEDHFIVALETIAALDDRAMNIDKALDIAHEALSIGAMHVEHRRVQRGATP